MVYHADKNQPFTIYLNIREFAKYDLQLDFKLKHISKLESNAKLT